MTRLWWVLLTSLVLLAALWSVRDFDASTQPADEILAYEISSDMDLAVSVPGGIARVLITTWLLVPLGTLDATYPYGVQAEVGNRDGELLTTRTFETRSRSSEAARGVSLPAARLADASAGVCQPRTFELDVGALAGRAGVLRLSLLPDAAPETRVLLRLTHSVQRGELERQLIERTVSAAEVERIMAQRSSLGFFDIPLERRTDALGTWERRLTARGRDGRDYSSRRLLLGGPEAVSPREPWQYQGLPSSPGRRLALNVTGGATLRIRTSPNAELVVRDGLDAESAHTVPDSGELSLQLGNRGLRTISVYSRQEQQLLLSTPAEHRESWVTPRELRVIAGSLEVRPDYRRKAYYRLHARDPVRFDMAPMQRTLGLDLRAEVAAGEQWRRIEVVGQWTDSEGEPVLTARHSVRVPVSPFEFGEDVAVTERSIAKLPVPEGAVRLELYGSPSHWVAAFVDEPGVESPLPLPPYEQPPPDDFHWRFEPWDVAPFAVVHPDNRAVLDEHGRRVQVTTQVRLEPLEGFGELLSPRILQPRAPFIERPLMRRESYDPSTPFPSNGWVLVDAASTSPPLRVPDDGRLEWMYLAPSDALGGSWTLADQEAELWSEPVVVTKGRGAVDLNPRVVRLRFGGLGERGTMVFKATPTIHAPIVKQQSVYRLDPRQRLVFPFDRRPSELASLVIVAASRDRARSVRLRYRIDGGKLRTRGGFFNRLTEPEGEQVSMTGDFGRGLIWDDVRPFSSAVAPDHLTKLVVRLGDDLAPGPHTCHLEFESLDAQRSPLWVRAVLVGRLLEDEER